jgi:thiosulfate/3-mercaptopyruvate sulfurtransferase
MYQQYRETMLQDREMPLLVDAQWLQEHLGQVKVVDCSWHLPATKRVAREEHAQEHIPGAVFFDLDECRNKEAAFGEQMLPSTQQFEEYVASLGVSSEDHVVLYDNNQMVGIFSSPRTWFVFKTFGHHNVAVLDGGLPEWKRNGGEVTSEATKVTGVTYKATFHPEMVVGFEDVLRNVETMELSPHTHNIIPHPPQS